MTWGLFRDGELITTFCTYEGAAVTRYNVMQGLLQYNDWKNLPKYEIIDLNSRNCESCPECKVIMSFHPAISVPDPNSETCKACLFEGD